MNADYQLQLQYDVPASALFIALASQKGAESWWTKFCQVSEDIGGESYYRFPGAGFHAVMKVLTKEPPQLLEWQCTDSKHADDTGHADLRDWTGTRIRFEIQAVGEVAARLHFTHHGLRKLECLDSCSQGWTFFLDTSLRGYLEQGQGQPWDKDAPEPA